jgi:uncharacterized protein (TIGR00251 family)
MRMEIKVNANARKDEVIEDVILTVNVKEKPENNKANLAVIKLLEDYFDRQVRIVSGLKGRKKIIEICP